MDIEQAIEYALGGRSVLFVGAGFSIGAKTLQGTMLKTGKTFAKHLALQVGLPEDTPLEFASERFINDFGYHKLIQELTDEFTTNNIKHYHKAIARVPWKRIYTTNYDNVLEFAYSQENRRLNSVTISDNIYDSPKGDTLCVHLNGYIERLSTNTLDSELKLTNTSYVTSSVADSPWAGVFRQDIQVARSIFFIGYSLADLDIKRILSEDKFLRDKCFFIVGENPDPWTSDRTQAFGSLLYINTSHIAEQISEVESRFSAPGVSDLTNTAVVRFEPLKQPSSLVVDQDVLNLLLLGDIKGEHVFQSIHEGSNYFLQRQIISVILKSFEEGKKAVVIHSGLGNGKTLLLQGIKILAYERGYEVFEFVDHSEYIKEEIEAIMANTTNPFFVVDNYHDWFDELEYLCQNSSDQVTFLVAARTSIHDVTVDRLCETLNLDSITEISVDQLHQKDIEWLAEYFDEYGLWRKNALWSTERKRSHIQNKYRGQFHAVLLDLLESPQIVNRFNHILEDIRTEKGYTKPILSILILTVLNEIPTINMLTDLWGSKILNSGFRRNESIKQLIDFDENRFRLHSSVAAQYILKNFSDAQLIIETLKHMAIVCDRSAKHSEKYYNLRVELMRFSNLQYLLPEKHRRAAMLNYYESIKNLMGCRRNPLFWLQYAIACLVFEKYERAEIYFDTAYSFADSRDFNTFQIDNHYARFLLAQSISIGGYEQAMESFRKARNIINKQIQDERRHYPYHVAEKYADFYDKFESQFSIDEIEEIILAGDSVLKQISTLEYSRQNARYVRDCKNAIEYLLERSRDRLETASKDSNDTT